MNTRISIFSRARSLVTSEVIPWLIFFGVGTLFVVIAYSHLPYMSDDAFIALRYAKRLTQGHGLTWTDGERVEGYTDLFWVLLNALTGGISGNFVWSARLWGTVGGLSVILFASLSNKGFRLDYYRLLSSGLLLAGSVPLAIWSMGGLEHGFLAGLLAGALFFLFRALDGESIQQRDLMIASLLFAFVCITRADAPLYCAAAGLGMFIHLVVEKKPLSALVRFASLPTVFVAGQMIFRIVYYGDWIPNTARAKVAFTDTRLNMGVEFISKSLPDMAIIAALATFGIVVSYKKIRLHRWLIPLVISACWIGYQIIVGGDHFYAQRQMVPLFAPLALVLSEGVSKAKWLIKEQKTAALGALVLLAIVNFTINYGDQRVKDVRIRNHWEWNGESFGHLLRTAFKKQKPMIAVDAAGALPFWSELPALDMLGLNDGYLTKNLPKNFGNGPIGHELGSGPYVMKRSPDIIVFNHAGGDPGSAWPPGRQLAAMPSFHEAYQLSRFRAKIGNQVQAQVFIKKENSAIGITRTQDMITVPSYLFTGTDTSTPAQMDDDDRLYIPINRRLFGKVHNLWLDKGTWALVTDQALVGVHKQVDCYDSRVEWIAHLHEKHVASPVITASERVKVTITVGPNPTTAEDNRLYNVYFKKVDRNKETQICSSLKQH